MCSTPFVSFLFLLARLAQCARIRAGQFGPQRAAHASPCVSVTHHSLPQHATHYSLLHPFLSPIIHKMPKIQTHKKASKTSKLFKQPPEQKPGFFSGLTRAFSAFTGAESNHRFYHFISSTARFTRSGLVTAGSFAWYVVTTAMVVVFPIRRAIEMDILMEEERQREAQRFNPDAVLPSVPGLYPSGSGASTVPITPGRY